MRWTFLLAVLVLPGLACAEDYVFFHNNDSITMENVGGDISVGLCSISSKSTYEFVCNSNNQTYSLNKSNTWVTRDCTKNGNSANLKIVVREKGQHGGSGTVGPANSDMVVRVSGVTVTQVQGRDTKAKVDANKCK